MFSNLFKKVKACVLRAKNKVQAIALGFGVSLGVASALPTSADAALTFDTSAVTTDINTIGAGLIAIAFVVLGVRKVVSMIH